MTRAHTAGLKTRPTTGQTRFARFLLLPTTRPGDTTHSDVGRVFRPGDTTGSPARGEMTRAHTAGLKTRPTTGQTRLAKFRRLQTTRPGDTTHSDVGRVFRPG